MHKRAGLISKVLFILTAALAWQSSYAISIEELRGGFDESLLWRCEAPNGKTNHLFGTIHSSDRRVMNLARGLDQRLANAQSVALELDFNPADTLGALIHMMLPLSETLPQRVGNPLAERAYIALDEYGLPKIVIDRLQPWAVTMLLSMPPESLKGGVFLDQMLAERAMSNPSQALIGLETIEEQIAIFSNLSDADQKLMLKEALDNQQQNLDLLSIMTNAWLKGDLASLVRMAEESMQHNDQDLAKRFMRSILIDRNTRMADRLAPLFQNGQVFAAVGALHLPGTGGVVALLEKKGFRCTPIPFPGATF